MWERLSFLEATHARLSTPPTAAEVQRAVEKDFRWRLAAGDGVYALERRVTGRVVITNYDPRTLSDAERQALNTRAGANPGNFVLIDIRPGILVAISHCSALSSCEASIRS